MKAPALNLSKRNGLLIPALASVVFIVSCVVVSSKKYFWNDELYSHHLLADPSFVGMLGAFHDKINNTPPLYFVTGWLWAQVFGAGELSLRLFSCLGICVALWLVWITLRRAFGTWAGSIGTLAVFCTSDIILSQNAEARMYGLYLALFGLALFLYDRLSLQERCSRRFLIVLFLTHAAIVNTHLFGAFYSGAMFAALLLSDVLAGRFRLKVYLTFASSWLALLLYLPSFLIQADAGRPRTWLPTPNKADLLEYFDLSYSALMGKMVPLLFVVAAALHALFLNLRKDKDAEVSEAVTSQPQGIRPLLILGFAFLVLPVFIWIVSRALKPIFWERYMMPSSLGWSIFLAYLWATLFESSRSIITLGQASGRGLMHTKRWLLPALLVTVLLVQPLLYAKGNRQLLPGVNDGKFGYDDLPIVVQSSARFLERRYYSPQSDRYFFILDWESAVDEASGLFGPQEYKHMDAFLRNYPDKFAGHIMFSDEFLEAHDRFLVLDFEDYDKPCPTRVKGLHYGRNWIGMHCPQWVERRLLSDPRFTVVPLGVIYGETVLLVETRKDR